MQRKVVPTWVWIVAGLVVLGAIINLVKDDKATATADSAKPSVTASEPSTELAKTAEVSAIPSPDAAQTAVLLRALRAVHPGLVVKEDRAVSRARDICLDIRADEDAEAIQSKARARYEGGTLPSLTDDQAADIVAAVKSAFCD